MTAKSISSRKIMYSQRHQRRGKRGKYKHMPSRRLIRVITAKRLINKILKEKVYK